MNLVQLNDTKTPYKGKLKVPSSKSISNRVLILQHLSGVSFKINNISISNDTQLLNKILNSNESIINTQDAGTVMRFLVAHHSISNGEFILTGSERMKERPIKDLVDALLQLGAKIEYLDKVGYPPLKIIGCKLSGKEITIKSNVSSQFISAIMLIAPFLDNGITINLTGEIVSFPYIVMTKNILEYFGIKVIIDNQTIKVYKGNILNKDIKIETDWSSLSFIYCLLSLKPGSQITVNNCHMESWQGDAVLQSIMQKFGVQSRFDKENLNLTSNSFYTDFFEYNFKENPDLVPPLVVLCFIHKLKFKFEGVASLQFKESKRLQSLTDELSKLGAQIFYNSEEIYCTGYNDFDTSEKIILESYNDHRLTMAFSLITLKYDNIWVKNPQTIEKSYPNFWENLKELGIQVKITNHGW